MRFGRSLVIVAHAREIAHATWLQRKGILPLPAPAGLDLLQLQTFVKLHQTKCSCGIDLFPDGFQTQRFEKQLVESDVGQPRIRISTRKVR